MGYSRSSCTDLLTWKSRTPRRSTLPVCMSDTIDPRSTASLARPRVPTRYAAITVLPCPGARACTDPTRKARPSIVAMTHGVSAWRVIRLAKLET